MVRLYSGICESATFGCSGIVTLVLLFAWSCTDPGESILMQPGVPLELAEYRKAQIRDLRYELAFAVPDSVEKPILGRETIRWFSESPESPVVLDFRQDDGHLLAVRVGNRKADYRFEAGHIILPESILSSGENSVSIDFIAGEESLNRRPDYLYSVFVPDRASLAFPCFDQPDLKARFQLSLDLPAGWSAVANGAELDRAVQEGRQQIRFATTPPISTYLFSFAAGIFQLERSRSATRAMTMLHRESDREKVERNLGAVFALHSAALEWLEKYTGIDYPFEKFDFVLIPDFQFGGMEHPGAILYRSSSLLLDESATQSQYLNRARLIAHETAHMWFGDLVTMKWFNDVWTKEVFANFLAAKIVNPAFPDVNHQLRFLLSHYPSAYEVDRTAGTHPIRQHLENLNDAASLYGAIIYQKAPVIMLHLEQQIGEESFREGLREYLQKFQFDNATWPDLIAIMDQRSDGGLASWSERWVEQAGRPKVSTQLLLETDGTIRSLRFPQEDPLDEDRYWVQPLEVRIGFAFGERTFQLDLNAPVSSLEAARGLSKPRYILPNARGTAYGLFRFDEDSRRYFLDQLPGLPEELMRAVIWVQLWEEMLEGLVPPETIFDLCLSALPREGDEQIRELILSYLDRIFWRFLPAQDRLKRSAEFEAQLWELLEASAEESTKSAYFRTFRSVALTDDGRSRLMKVWSREEVIRDLRFSETDFMTLALELAVREVPQWRRVLDEQESRIENEERRSRFQFVRQAVSADSLVRDRFFHSLVRIENRSKEQWVVEALRYLHHPLRSRESEKYLLPGLQMLREIKRTGDIFFPKAWLDASLDGHQSEEAAQVVRTFLQVSDDPPRLLGKVRQSADGLFRAARMVNTSR